MGTFGNTFGNSLGGQLTGEGTAYFTNRYPSSLVQVATSYTQNDLSWTNNGAQDYDNISIERSSDNATFAEIGTALTGATTYSDTTAVSGTVYFYRIRYVKNAEYSEYSNVAKNPNFITKWDTTLTGGNNVPGGTLTTSQLRFPTYGTGYNCVIIWGDGASETYTGGTANTANYITHTYASPGQYIVSVSGVYPSFYGDTSEGNRLIGLINWGSTAWQNMANGFYRYWNLEYFAHDIPNVTACTSFQNSFAHDVKFTGNINGWDTSHVTVFQACFEGCLIFSSDLDEWNTSSATNMHQMFYSCAQFSGDISTWDVSKVTTMSGMFFGCSKFNSNISAWVTSALTTADRVFQGCSLFNSPLDSWDVSKITTMASMFASCSVFNQPLNTWNTANVTVMTAMFSGCSVFNQSLNSWNTSKVTLMNTMFATCSAFNGNITSWDTSKVTSMAYMFYTCKVFNQPIGAWNVSSVTTMANMFTASGGFAFQQDISAWNIIGVTTMENMFLNATLNNAIYNAILIGWSALAIKSNVLFHAGASKYSAGTAATARGILTGTYTWTITDGGQL